MTRIVITKSDSSPWTCPADCQKITTLRLIGGGSGGNGGVYYMGTPRGGKAGVAGSLTSDTDVSVTPGQTYAFSVGAKGNGGPGDNRYYYNGGGDGGSTTFLGRSAAGGDQYAYSLVDRKGGDGENGPYTGVSGEPSADRGLGWNSDYWGAGGVGYGAGGGGGDGGDSKSPSGYGFYGGAGADGCIIIEYTAAPVAAFSGTPTSGNSPLSVTFTDSSTGSPTSWLWQYKLHAAGSWTDFTNSTSQNPTQSFSSGTFDIKLTVTSPYGTDVEQKDSYITANVVAPVADFTLTPDSGNAPLDVGFTDTSSNTPTSWLWEYSDDGLTWTEFDDSTSQNPTQTFSVVGTYSVKLTATNSAGSDSQTYVDCITVTGDPTAAFLIHPSGITNNTLYTPKIKLYDRSRYYGATKNTFAWSVTASGETPINSTLQNPVITLPSVTDTTVWTVSLTVTDSNSAESDPATATFIQHKATL